MAPVTLVIASERIPGSSGCNRDPDPVIQGDTPTDLTIGPLATRRMTELKPVMNQERAFLESLQNTVLFQYPL